MRLGVLIFSLLVAAGVGAQPMWRLSDALGNDRGPVVQGRTQLGWTLRIEARDGGEERALFQNGVLDSLRLVDLDSMGRVLRWRDLRGGQPVWEITFDPVAGVPVTETTFEGNHPHTVATWTFDQRVFVGQTVRTPEGELLYEDRLYHWPDGTLRRLERDGPQGPLAEAAWSFGPQGQLTGAWLVDEEARTKGQHREWIYGRGRIEETWATDAALLTSRVTEALEVGQRETRTDAVADRKEVRLTDAKGRTVELTVWVKEVLSETRRWNYDPQGRLVETTLLAAGVIEAWTYDFQPGGVVVGTLTRDGVRVREETLRDGDKVWVRLYDRGDLFLVETWSQGKRVKESYYQKGQLVRERTL